MIIVASVQNNNILKLAEKTWPNKVAYAEKHNYDYVVKTDDWVFEPRHIGWERMQFILDIFEAYPDTEWLWLTGADSLVTNFNIKIEDRISDTHDIVVAGDFNEPIVDDSLLVKNTPRARAYLQDMMDAMPDYVNHHYAENGWMLETYEKYKDVVKIVPQHMMNSYEYRMYRVAPWNYEGTTDTHGHRGQWEPGDWLVHWPGTQLHERLALVEEYQDKVIY